MRFLWINSWSAGGLQSAGLRFAATAEYCEPITFDSAFFGWRASLNLLAAWNLQMFWNFQQSFLTTVK